MKKVKLNYKDIVNIVKVLAEQEENVVEVTPEDIKKYLEYVSYNGDQLSKFPQFRGKQIKVIGKLDLRGTPLTSLGPIVDSDSIIDISNTNVRSLSNYKGSKHKIHYWGTPLMKIERQNELRKKQNLLDSYRENDDWALEKGDPIGEKAWALLYYLETSLNYNVLTKEDFDKKNEIIQRLDEIKEQYENTSDPEQLDQLSDEISELEEKLEEYSEYIDVYDLFPQGSFYNMTEFKINRIDRYNEEFAVGTEDEIRRSAFDYAENLIDDIGLGGFNRSFIERHVDEDAVVDFLDYDSDVRNNPDVYFDSNDYDDFSSSLLKQIGNLKKKIQSLELEYNTALESGDDDKASELEDDLDDLKSELEDLESSPDEVSEETIQNKIDEMNDDARRNAVEKINEHGFDIDNFINKGNLIEDYVDSDGYEIINSYNGEYDTYEVNDTRYYIMQVAG